jgi:lactoylglutathione lyase
MNTKTSTIDDVKISAALPSRILYSMIRVADLDRSIAFYRDALGMNEIKRETFTEGRFTLLFMGYGDDYSAPTVELTYNWDPEAYTHGSGYGHIALAVEDIYAACERLKSLGVNVNRKAGPMTCAVDETGKREVIAFIKDPDGYSIELIEHQ